MKLFEIPDLNIAPDYKLTELQERGARFLLAHKGAVLKSSTGSGKSLLTTTCAAHVVRRVPNVKSIILCPASANKAMTGAVKSLRHGYTLYEASGRSGNGLRPDFHIFNFSSMGRYMGVMDALKEKNRIVGIIDEAHALQRTGSNQFEHFNRLRNHFSILWLSTATPLMSVAHMRGLYNLVSYLSPSFFGSWSKFRNEYLRTELETFQVRGKTITNENVISIREPDLLRAKLEDIMINLTIEYNVRYHYRSCPLKDVEIEYYRKAGAGLMEEVSKDTFAHRLHDLQRVVDWSHETLPPEFANKVSSKERLFLNLLNEIFEKGLSAVVYVEYIDTADRLKRLLSKAKEKGICPKLTEVFSITGKDSKASRNAVEDKIRPGSVVICTQAGSQSRNLQKASQVIIYDIPFSIGRFQQVIGRVTRMDSEFEGQDVYFIEAEGTIDTYKRMLIQDNASTLDSLFGKDTNLPDLSKLDRSNLRKLRQELLWKFSGYFTERNAN